MKEVLMKVFNKPGLCSIKELEDSKEFISRLKPILELYISVTGYEPSINELSRRLDTLDWYIDRANKGE